jgi:glutathione S-transferase
MALKYAGIEIEHREIELKNKPKSMLLASSKGTVPVLCLNGFVLDQSLDIMRWALQQSDPDGWDEVDQSIPQSWIKKNDGPFKVLLDQYKYPNRFPDLDQESVFSNAIALMIGPMDDALQLNPYLLGDKISWVDIAIFPFIRQFAAVNAQRFEGLPFIALKKWLNQHLESELFRAVMEKHPVWIDALEGSSYRS